MTIREFIDDYMFRARHQSFPVTGDGGDTLTGLVTLDRIKHVPASTELCWASADAHAFSRCAWSSI